MVLVTCKVSVASRILAPEGTLLSMSKAKRARRISPVAVEPAKM